MKPLFTTLLLAFTCSLHAQQFQQIKPSLKMNKQPGLLQPDSLKNLWRSNGSFVRPANDHSVLPLKNTGTYQYNNGKGSDVYAMNTDGMPCIVPDSTFVYDMHNGKNFRRKPEVKE